MDRLIFCSACEQNLSVDHFRAGKIGPNTARLTCKKCQSKRVRKWNIEHPDRVKINRKNHYLKSGKETAKRWRENHREVRHATAVKWRNEHPEEWKIICRRTRHKNAEKILIRNRECEILEKTRMPAWADRNKIHEIYIEAKRRTRETGILHHVDHIIPLRGKLVCGLHVESNLQILTASENIRKGNKVLIGGCHRQQFL